VVSGVALQWRELLVAFATAIGLRYRKLSTLDQYGKCPGLKQIPYSFFLSPAPIARAQVVKLEEFLCISLFYKLFIIIRICSHIAL
jgi:hypothetical protein